MSFTEERKLRYKKREIRFSGKYGGRNRADGEEEPEDILKEPDNPKKKHGSLLHQEAPNDYRDFFGEASVDADVHDGQGRNKKIENGRKNTGNRGMVFIKRTVRSMERKVKKTKDRLQAETESSMGHDDTLEEIKSVKKTTAVTGGVFAAAAALVKGVISLAVSIIKILFTNIYLLAAVVVITLVGSAILFINTLTYDFLIDEEENIASYISTINYDFTQKMKDKKGELSCDGIRVSGELADWKEIISFWWAFRSRSGKSDRQENYLTGVDVDDLTKIFYEFNIVTYEVVPEGEKTMLAVNIENETIDYMMDDYAFTDEQRRYVDELLGDKDLWREIFSTDELARYAVLETGQTKEKYLEWYGADDGSDWNMAYIMYLLDECKAINGVTRTLSAEAFYNEMQRKGWMAFTLIPKEGDIIFIDVSGDIKCGIITGSDDTSYHVTIGGYPGYDMVTEIFMAKQSKLIKGCGRIDVSIYSLMQPDVMIAGEFAWPVDGYCYVTSAYGARDLLGMSFHHGMDIGCPTGTPILACLDGTVTYAGYGYSLGNYIVIDHGGGLKTTYGHNSSLVAAKGDYVTQGQVIAYAGSTGQSTGPHCHIAVMLSGNYNDPSQYFGLPVGFTGDASPYIQ